jgi:hypothetical protein
MRTLVDLGLTRDQGEGIPRMFAEMEDAFLPAPRIEPTARNISVVLGNTTTHTEGHGHARRSCVRRLSRSVWTTGEPVPGWAITSISKSGISWIAIWGRWSRKANSSAASQTRPILETRLIEPAARFRARSCRTLRGISPLIEGVRILMRQRRNE